VDGGPKVGSPSRPPAGGTLAVTTTFVLTAIPNFFDANCRRGTANVLMAVLLVVFAMRLAKTKKFMPAGLMLVVTIAALALRNIRF